MLRRFLRSHSSKLKKRVFRPDFISSVIPFDHSSLKPVLIVPHFQSPSLKPAMSEAPASCSSSAVTVAAKEPFASEENRVWIDCEMSNLDLKDWRSQLVEIAVIITDKDLNILAEGPDIVINQTEEVLEGLSDWCRDNFAQSGLLSQIKESKITMKEAENKILNFIKPWTIAKKCKLHGNSIYVDRMFIKKDMPELDNYLHYRLIDVSTVKELTYSWFPKEFEAAPAKTYAHRALSDIRESIAELKYYRNAVFKVITKNEEEPQNGNSDDSSMSLQKNTKITGEKRGLSEAECTDTPTPA